MSFGLDLQQAIKNVQIAKAAHKSFKAAAKVGVSEAEADANCVGPDCDGYDVLRKKVDDCLCLLYTSPSPRDQRGSRMPSSA